MSWFVECQNPSVRMLSFLARKKGPPSERLNRVIWKSSKTRGALPTEGAATKLICMAIGNLEKGGRNVREWFAARNQLAIIFGERFDV